MASSQWYKKFKLRLPELIGKNLHQLDKANYNCVKVVI